MSWSTTSFSASRASMRSNSVLAESRLGRRAESSPPSAPLAGDGADLRPRRRLALAAPRPAYGSRAERRAPRRLLSTAGASATVASGDGSCRARCSAARRMRLVDSTHRCASIALEERERRARFGTLRNSPAMRSPQRSSRAGRSAPRPRRRQPASPARPARSEHGSRSAAIGAAGSGAAGAPLAAGGRPSSRVAEIEVAAHFLDDVAARPAAGRRRSR